MLGAGSVPMWVTHLAIWSSRRQSRSMAPQLRAMVGSSYLHHSTSSSNEQQVACTAAGRAAAAVPTR